MATYSSWGTIFWSIFDACYTSEHPFFSGFEAEKSLHVIHACVVYTEFYGNRFAVQVSVLMTQKDKRFENIVGEIAVIQHV